MQREMPVHSTMQRAPRKASATVFRQIETEAQAIDVSIKSSGFKALFVARSLGCSEAWISQLRKGRHCIPRQDTDKRERFIREFCRVTGTTLLADFIELQEALEAVRNSRSQNQINERLAAQLRAA
jgi:hypothetical protein